MNKTLNKKLLFKIGLFELQHFQAPLLLHQCTHDTFTFTHTILKYTYSPNTLAPTSLDTYWHFWLCFTWLMTHFTSHFTSLIPHVGTKGSNLYKLELTLRAFWYMHLNNNFQFLNNITRIFIHFFTHTYFRKIQITLLEDEASSFIFLNTTFLQASRHFKVVAEIH